MDTFRGALRQFVTSTLIVFIFSCTTSQAARQAIAIGSSGSPSETAIAQVEPAVEIPAKKAIIHGAPIVELLSQLINKIDAAIPDERRTRRFKNTFRLTHSDLTKLTEQLEGAPLKLQQALEELGEELDEVATSDEPIDIHQISAAAKTLRRFRKKLEKMKLKDKVLSEALTNVAMSFDQDLLDVTLLPPKTWKEKAVSKAAYVKKRAIEKGKWARAHKWQAAKWGFKKGKWAIGAYLTYRMMLESKKDYLMRFKETALQDLGRLKKFGKTLWVTKSLSEAFRQTVTKISQNLDSNIRFKDIIGMEEDKKYFMQLANRTKTKEGKQKLTRGILLIGPPGVGKTRLLTAFINEARMNVFVVSGPSVTQPWMLEYWYFKPAYKNAPSVIFIDEIEKMKENVKASLLTLTEGASVDKSKAVILVAAANYRAQLPKELRRRFQKVIDIKLPNKEDRIKYIKYFLDEELRGSKIQKTDEVNDALIKALADAMEGFSPAYIRAVVGNAVREAFEGGKLGRKQLLSETYGTLLEQLQDDAYLKEYRSHGEATKEKLERLLGMN